MALWAWKSSNPHIIFLLVALQCILSSFFLRWSNQVTNIPQTFFNEKFYILLSILTSSHHNHGRPLISFQLIVGKFDCLDGTILDFIVEKFDGPFCNSPKWFLLFQHHVSFILSRKISMFYIFLFFSLLIILRLFIIDSQFILFF